MLSALLMDGLFVWLGLELVLRWRPDRPDPPGDHL